jgi:hypothetical protein
MGVLGSRGEFDCSASAPSEGDIRLAIGLLGQRRGLSSVEAEEHLERLAVGLAIDIGDVAFLIVRGTEYLA